MEFDQLEQSKPKPKFIYLSKPNSQFANLQSLVLYGLYDFTFMIYCRTRIMNLFEIDFDIEINPFFFLENNRNLEKNWTNPQHEGNQQTLVLILIG